MLATHKSTNKLSELGTFLQLISTKTHCNYTLAPQRASSLFGEPLPYAITPLSLCLKVGLCLTGPRVLHVKLCNFGLLRPSPSKWTEFPLCSLGQFVTTWTDPRGKHGKRAAASTGKGSQMKTCKTDCEKNSCKEMTFVLGCDVEALKKLCGFYFAV